MSSAKDENWVLSSKFPWCEGAMLPGTALVAVTALLFIALRAIILIWGIPFGFLSYAAVAIAVGIGAYATCIAVYYNLPFYLRMVDLLLVISLSSILVYWENAIAAQYIVPITMLAWVLAYYSTIVIPRLLPAEVPNWITPKFQQCIWEKRLRALVYAGTDANIVSNMALRRALDMLAMFMAVLVIATAIPISHLLADDRLFALWVAFWVVGVLTYYALVKQLALRRVVENNKEVIVIGGYTKAWLLGIMAPALVALAMALLLPANISPLIIVDWNQFMNKVTIWFVNVLFINNKRPNLRSAYSKGHVNVGSYGGSSSRVRGSGLIGSMDPLGLLVGLVMLILLLTVIYIGTRRVVGVLETRGERHKGAWATLIAIILWPWHIFVRWWQRWHMQVQHWQDSQRITADKTLFLKQMRQHWQYPQDPVEYIRFVYRRLLRKGAEAGYLRPANVTACEYAHILAKACPNSEQSVEELTDIYCYARYGRKPPEKLVRSQVLNLLRKISHFLRHRRYR